MIVFFSPFSLTSKYVKFLYFNISFHENMKETKRSLQNKFTHAHTTHQSLEIKYLIFMVNLTI